jgi:hypothetical protein
VSLNPFVTEPCCGCGALAEKPLRVLSFMGNDFRGRPVWYPLPYCLACWLTHWEEKFREWCERTH